MSEQVQEASTCESGQSEIDLVSDFELEWRPSGKGKQLIRATRDGATLHFDEINVHSAAARKSSFRN